MADQVQNKSDKTPILEDVDITIPDHGSVAEVKITSKTHHTGFNVELVAKSAKLLVVAGAASFLFGFILEICALFIHREDYYRPTVWVSQVGVGLWSGLVFAGVGIFIHIVVKRISTCYIVAIMAVTTSATVLAILEIVLSIASIAVDMNSYRDERIPSTHRNRWGDVIDDNQGYGGYRGNNHFNYFVSAKMFIPNFILILLGFFILALLIVTAVFSCIAACCRRNPAYLRINIYEPVAAPTRYEAPYATQSPMQGVPSYYSPPGFGGGGGAMQPIIMMSGGNQQPSAYQTFQLVPVAGESPAPSSGSTPAPNQA